MTYEDPRPSTMISIEQRVDARFGAICRTYSHGEAIALIREAIASVDPKQEDAEIEVRTHCVDGEYGPAYLARILDGETVWTLLVSIEFGCVSIAEGVRGPSYWS